jgi:hypothetical protein
MIGAFIPRTGDSVGCFDPARVLVRLETVFGGALECDRRDRFEGHVDRYREISVRRGDSPDNVVVRSETRKAVQYSPRYHFRLRTGPDSWIEGKLDRCSIYLFCEKMDEIPEPTRGRFIAFLHSLRLGECTVEVADEKVT